MFGNEWGYVVSSFTLFKFVCLQHISLIAQMPMFTTVCGMQYVELNLSQLIQ